MSIGSRIEAIRKKDARRPGFPGEHLAVLGTGVLLLLTAGRSHSLARRLLAGAAGGALVGRAASGTGGLARIARMMHGGRGERGGGKSSGVRVHRSI